MALTAAALWRALGQAGVTLFAVDGQLRYDAPEGAVTPAWRTWLQAEKPALVALLSGAFRAEVAAWSPARRERYEERAAIGQHEGGLSRPQAEHLAYLEARDTDLDALDPFEDIARLGPEEGEELFSWPGWAQGRWQLETEHRVARGLSRPWAERQAFEATRAALANGYAGGAFGAPAAERLEEPPPRCANPRCKHAPNLLGLRSCPNCGWARKGIAPETKARSGDGRVASPHGDDREVCEAEEEGAHGVRLEARPVLSPLCCGGCGVKALTDGGKGPCGRCGWRRTARGDPR